VTCLVVISVAGLALLTQARLRESQSDASKSDLQGAISAAEDARALEPWASSPYLQLALLDEQSGDLASARAWVRDALDHDGSDWRIWLVAARIDTKAGAIASARRALARARSLNPRSPLFARR
jgi:Tfp pilus assembly protein PilF